jgi:Ras-related protein Rab-6A
MVDQESHEDSVDNSISVTRHKIIFVGDAATGKTSIINRIIDNPFNDTYEVSIGIDFMSKNIRFRGQNIKIQIWDSAGQEKYKGLIPSYVRNSSIVFIVYDISNRSSFDNIPNWISFVKNIEKTTMILCGNKTDLDRDVNRNEAEELAEREGLLFFECSAKTNENIKNMFYSSIAGLPTFGIYDQSEKENLIRDIDVEDVFYVVESKYTDKKEASSSELLQEDYKKYSGMFPIVERIREQLIREE